MRTMRNIGLIILLCGGVLACGGQTTDQDTTGADTAGHGDGTTPADLETSGGDAQTLGLPNEHRLPSGLITSGAPDRAALEAARDAGATTVISLRTMDEANAADEQPMVEELGMTFVSIPVSGADGITEANARAVDEAIGDAEGTTILHCTSSNRAGAMVALRAFFVQEASKEDALALGREAGLSRSEDAVIAAIDAHCEANPDRC